MKPSLPPSGRGGRVGERVDVWTLRVMSIAVDALPADVPDNRPLSDRFTGRSLFREAQQQLADGAREY